MVAKSEQEGIEINSGGEGGGAGVSMSMFDPKYSECICSEVTFCKKSWSFSVSIDRQM